MKDVSQRLFRFLASPWLTAGLLALCMVIVFLGTIEQPANGLRPVQQHYFEGWYAPWPLSARERPWGWLALPLPGGFSLGVLLLANLLCAAARYFRLSWGKAGMLLIHLGFLVLLAGGFAIAALQEEFHMEIQEGGACDYLLRSTAPGSPESPERVPLPFTLRLDKFTHEFHPGSSIPKNYASRLRILEKPAAAPVQGGAAPASPDGAAPAVAADAGRAVEIRMNAPLRHGGFSFFQSSYKHAPDGRPSTILQVVRNPGWALPYVAFYLMGAGMLLQFLTDLLRFLARRGGTGNGAAKAGLGKSPVGKASKAAAILCATALAALPASAGAEGRDGMDARLSAGISSEFGRLPVQHNGRLQPADSLARNALFLIRGRQSVAFPEAAAVMFGTRPSQWTLPTAQMERETGVRLGPAELAMLERFPVPLEKGFLTIFNGSKSLPASAWMLEVAFRPALAAHFPLFRVENAEVRDLLGQKPGAIAHYSWNEISLAWEKIQKAAAPLDEKKPRDYTAFEHGLAKLFSAVQAYSAIAGAFAPPDLPEGRLPNEEYAEWVALNRAALAARDATRASNTQRPGAPPPLLALPSPRFGQREMVLLSRFLKRYDSFEREGTVGILPPDGHGRAGAGAPEDGERWENLGGALKHRHPGEEFKVPAPLRLHGDLAAAWNAGDAGAAAKAVAALTEAFQPATTRTGPRLHAEALFNRAEPFFKTLILYGVVFALVCAAWVTRGRRLVAVAFWTALAVLLLHTAAIGARMWIQGRPPVTNLYSTAIVVSWGAVVLGLAVERLMKNGMGTAAAAVAGFASLILAHNLAMNGDTLGMMQAVLDDNFWLATHVVTITLGYSGMFAAGLFAIFWLLRRLSGRMGAREQEDPLGRVVHGMVCFALLLSFAGTMLGGLWADKSWGRFWGWDPKENGALLVVLWCVVFLHARAFRLLGDAGLMRLAVGGNIVTAASWFGTNLLSTGLHSYGFSQGGFFWLSAFWLSQLALVGLSFLPPLRKTCRGAE
ncbi:MAG: cytochrome c biogenesis protein ResB [Puniceicoccales bacterium]|nr:cytochrome c biogenesis protein ResB [Puniceicoccales bacterium]